MNCEDCVGVAKRFIEDRKDQRCYGSIKVLPIPARKTTILICWILHFSFCICFARSAPAPFNNEPRPLETTNN